MCFAPLKENIFKCIHFDFWIKVHICVFISFVSVTKYFVTFELRLSITLIAIGFSPFYFSSNTEVRLKMDSSAESVNNKLKKRKRDQTDWIPNQLDETDWFFVIHLPLTFIPTVADRPPMPSKPFGTSCYICLDDNMTNKAYTNKCWHPFCYPCIKRWAMKRVS